VTRIGDRRPLSRGELRIEDNVIVGFDCAVEIGATLRDAYGVRVVVASARNEVVGGLSGGIVGVKRLQWRRRNPGVVGNKILWAGPAMCRRRATVDAERLSTTGRGPADRRLSGRGDFAANPGHVRITETACTDRVRDRNLDAAPPSSPGMVK